MNLLMTKEWKLELMFVNSIRHREMTGSCFMTPISFNSHFPINNIFEAVVADYITVEQ